VRQRWWAELQAGGHQVELLRLVEPAVIELQPWPPGRAAGLAAVAGLHLVLVGAATAAELLVIELGVGGTCSGAPVRVIAERCTRPSCCAWSSRR